MPFGIVLAGGGTRGAAHVGVLLALEENGLRPNAVAGASAGGIVAGLYASGCSAVELKQIVQDLCKNGRKLVDPAYLDLLKAIGQFFTRRPVSLSGLFKGEKLEQYLYTMTKGVRFSEVQMRTVIPSVDLMSGQTVIFTNSTRGVQPVKDAVWESGGLLCTAMRASAAVPAMFCPKKIGSKCLIDGGVIDNLPVDLLLAAGAQNILAVDISKKRKMPDHIDVLTVAEHSLSIMQDRLQKCSYRGEKLLLKPALPEDAGLLHFDQMNACMEAGYEAAYAMLPAIRTLLALKSA